MQTVRLTPKTRKGQNVVNRDGGLFTVTRVLDRVLFSTEAGPWFSLAPATRNQQNWRFVHGTNDPNFTITEA